MKKLGNKHSGILVAVIAGAVFLLLSCTKSNVKWVYYDETRCADKWEYTYNNEKLKENFINYYNSRGIKIYEVEIFNDIAADPCADCTCKTGRRFKSKVKKGDATNLKRESFYE
jgi:hypothetical protein